MANVTQAQPMQGGIRLWLTRLFLRSEQLRSYSLLSPTMVVMLLFLALPLGIMFTLSFWTQTYVTYDKSFTISNYLAFFERPIYPYLLGKSLFMSLTVTVATVLLAYPMAYFLAFRVTQGKMVWLILITVPFWTSYLLRVFAWPATMKRSRSRARTWPRLWPVRVRPRMTSGCPGRLKPWCSCRRSDFATGVGRTNSIVL